MIQILLRSLVWLMNLAYRTQFASNECSEPRVLLKEVYNMRFDVNFILLSWKQLEVILVIQRQFLLNDRHLRYAKSRILIAWKALTVGIPKTGNAFCSVNWCERKKHWRDKTNMPPVMFADILKTLEKQFFAYWNLPNSHWTQDVNLHKRFRRRSCSFN